MSTPESLLDPRYIASVLIEKWQNKRIRHVYIMVYNANAHPIPKRDYDLLKLAPMGTPTASTVPPRSRS